MRSLLALAVVLAGACDRPAAPERTLRQQEAFDRYRRPDLLLAALGLRDGDHVADLGAGSGYLTLPMARAVGARGRVVATDVDGAALARLRARPAPPGAATIEARLVAADDPGLESERFDLILASEVDHLLADRVAWLSRVGRNLAPDGRLAIVNRRHDRAALLADASAAGLRPLDERDGLPAHFLLFFGAAP